MTKIFRQHQIAANNHKTGRYEGEFLEYTPKKEEKLDYSLIPPEFDDVAKVFMQAIASGKYGAHDWEKGINFDPEKNQASIKRHLAEDRAGILQDKESGLHPMLHAGARCLMKYTLDKRLKNEKK